MSRKSEADTKGGFGSGEELRLLKYFDTFLYAAGRRGGPGAPGRRTPPSERPSEMTQSVSGERPKGPKAGR